MTVWLKKKDITPIDQKNVTNQTLQDTSTEGYRYVRGVLKIKTIKIGHHIFLD